MYCEFYQLQERPFNVTPDPKFLYLNARYREAIASLHYGITQRKGFITLIGEAGTGKTTLLKRLLDELDQTTRTVFLFNTNVSFEEILEYMFAEFDLPVHSGKKLYMLQRLNMFLLEELRNGRNVALLIDEAQDLEYSVLEDLRLLSNLETAKEKIIQIVLSGQPELGQKLSNPVLRQLRQRISVNCRLLPLSRDEVSEYIRFRLEAAGAPDPKLFTREAEEQIYHFSRGIPRLVNVVCDNALVIGYAMGKKRITADIIDEAAADLLPADSSNSGVNEVAPSSSREQAPLERARPSHRRSWWPSLALGVAALASGLALWTAGRSFWQVYVAAPSSVEELASTPEFGDSGAQEAPAVSRPLEGVAVKANELRGEAAASQSAAVAPSDAEKAGQMAQGPPAQPTTSIPQVQTAPRLAMLADVPVESAPLPSSPEGVPLVGEGRAAETGGEVMAGATASAPPQGATESTNIVRESGDTDRGASAAPGATVPSLEELTAVLRGATRAEQEVGKSSLHTEEVPQVDAPEYKDLVVRPGDSLSGIARATYGQSSYTILDLIKLANPEVKDVDLIVPGQTLRLPDLREGPPIVRKGGGRYALLVFSTPNVQRAQLLAQALRRRGFPVQVEPTDLGAQKKVFRVTVEAGGAREEALRTGLALQRVLREDADIVRLGQ